MHSPLATRHPPLRATRALHGVAYYFRGDFRMGGLRLPVPVQPGARTVALLLRMAILCRESAARAAKRGLPAASRHDRVCMRNWALQARRAAGYQGEIEGEDTEGPLS